MTIRDNINTYKYIYNMTIVVENLIILGVAIVFFGYLWSKIYFDH